MNHIQNSFQPANTVTDVTDVAIDRTGSTRHFPTITALIESTEMDGPVFCFSNTNATEIVRRFRAGFPGKTSFAVKACPLPELIRQLYADGVDTFDVASPVEMQLVRAAAPGATLNYHNPIRSMAENRFALDQAGCRRFAVDDALTLDNLLAITDDPTKLEIIVRIGIPRQTGAYDFSTKFGAHDHEVPGLLGKIKGHGAKVGITFHPGSQCTNPSAYSDLIAYSAELAKRSGITLDILNVGGGFPADYVGAEAPELETYFADIKTAFNTHFDSQLTQLECEPGRALAAPTISLLVPVKHRRPEGPIFLADGVFGALMEMVYAPIIYPHQAWRGPNLLNGPLQPVQAFGPTCDPLDTFPHQLMLPEDIAAGDLVEFGLVGGYGPSTPTRFNGYGNIPVVNVARIFR